MKKTKFSHKVIATFLILTFLPSIFPVNYVFASNNGPTAPEAASFEPVDAPDMVNLATGDLSYVLPLLNVPSPEGGYPLALSYHAGIAMDQEASWVGLGWSLNTGAINRNIVGVPDDWKNGLKSKIVFDVGGTTTIENLNLGVGITDELSVGLNSTWVTNKTVGGEQSIDFNISASADYNINTEQINEKSGELIRNNSSVGLTFGSNGVGLSASYKQTGTGMNFGSNSNSLSFQGGLSFGNKTSASNQLSTRQIGSNWNVQACFGLFNVSYTKHKFKYWLYDEKDYRGTGSLYSGSFDEISSNDPLYYFNQFDATESPQSTVIDGLSFSKNNPSYITYDTYNVDAQGVNMSISPKLLEAGRIHSPAEKINSKSIYISANDDSERDLSNIFGFAFNRNAYGEGTGEIKSTLYKKSIEKTSKPYFYVDNEYSSYHKTNITGRSTFLTNQNEANGDNLFYDIDYYSNETFEGYETSSERMKKSGFIQVFTNQEILEDSNLILEVPNIDRNEMPENGIGAYMVTSADGKTYHYSLPVYQKEKGSIVTSSIEDIDNQYSEEHSLQPYATHWHLTAITGSDYVDDGDNKVDEEDLGYWVRFDYGKWSDGYGWRMPKIGYNFTDNAKGYSWGFKDIYYLNSVVTRTHTALFVKEPRQDNYSSTIISKEDSGGPVYKKSTVQGTALDIASMGTDGKYYWVGAYNRGHQSDVSFGVFSADNTIVSENWFYIDSKKTPSLALKQIILLKNDKVPSILGELSLSSGNYDLANPISSEIHFEEKNKYIYATNSQLVVKESPRESYVDKTYRGEYTNNILDADDYNFDSLIDDALKVISFNYSNDLGKIGNDTGKLTLEAVNFRGKEGKSIIPPYRFNYYGRNTNPNRSDFDDWGYNKNYSWVWSLEEIKNPLGGKIQIDYESDEFFEKSVASAYLDENLQIQFEGTNSGSKYVSVRQDPDINPEQKLNFMDLFEVGQSYELDIQYYRDPSNNGHNWIADIAGQGLAVNVSSSIVKFQIPTNSNKTWVRLKTNCHKKNWVYYQSGEYHHIVDETYNKDKWKGESREWYCDSPGDDSEKIRIRIHFNQGNSSQVGGGIRSKKLVVMDEMGNSYETSYKYNLLGTNNLLTNNTSGRTSYAPARKYQKDIPYLDLQPSPGVLYRNVRVTSPTGSYTDYVFNTLESYTLNNSAFENNILKIDVNQGFSSNVKQEGESRYFLIDEKMYSVENKISSLGALISRKKYNSYGQLISSVQNSYLEGVDLQGKFTSESFIKDEFINLNNSYDFPVNISRTKISKIPLVIDKTKELIGNYSFETKYGEFDLTTGKPTDIETIDSNGFYIRNTTKPAYTEYPAMGSKVDNLDNKNMLTQEAMTKTFKKIGEDWKEIGANITTWNKDWIYTDNEGAVFIPVNDSEKIWRKHKSFSWDGATDDDGIFTSFIGEDDGFDWSDPNANQPADWKQVSEVTKYDHFSMALEAIDVNDNKASTKMGDKDSKIFATGNAGYNELFYSGAEDLDGTTYGGEVGKGTATENPTDFHTGKKALDVSSGQTAFVVSVTEGKSKKYKVSLWAKHGAHTNVRLQVGGGAGISYKEEERVRAGDWHQLNFYFDINGTQTVNVTSNGAVATVDDFRLHPVVSSMTSYVYNEWDELTHIIGANNLATEYRYDAAGRLIETRSEVIDFNGDGSGGFKKVSENMYTYKYQ